MGQILEVKTIVETKSAEKDVENLTNKIDESTEATEGMVGALDKMTGGAITAFKGVVSGVKKGVMAMKTFKGAIMATGVGALVVVVGTLVTYFTSTQKGADMVNKAMAGIGATIDVLIDRMSTFGEGLMNIMTGNFSEGLDMLAGSFKGITTEILAEAAGAVVLETASQKLLKTKRDFIEQEAKLNADLEKYRLASENFDLSAAERLKANSKAQETAMELANKQMAIAKEELRILTEKNSLGESMNEDLDAEAEAKAKLFQIEQSRDALAKEFQAKAKGITDEQKGAAQAASAEAKALREKDDADKLAAAAEQAKKVEDARLEAIKEVDNKIREYKLTNDEVKLADLLVFEEQKRALELEQLDLSEAEKEAIRLSYKEKEVAATKETKAAETALEKKSSDDKLKTDKVLADARANTIAGGLALLASASKKGSDMAKAAAVAQVTFDTIRGVQAAFAQTTDVTPTQSLRFINAATAAAFGAVSISKILSAPTEGKGGNVSIPSSGGGARPSVEVPRIPNFENNNQGVGGRNGFGSMRAVVVQQDIKDSASLDNRVDDLIKVGK